MAFASIMKELRRVLDNLDKDQARVLNLSYTKTVLEKIDVIEKQKIGQKQASEYRDEFCEKFNERERLYNDIKKIVQNIQQQFAKMWGMIQPHVIDLREMDLYLDKCRRFLHQLEKSGPISKDLSVTLLLAW